MKNLITIVVICLLISSIESGQVSADRYIVEITVQLKKGFMDKVLELFKSTNPELVIK